MIIEITEEEREFLERFCKRAQFILPPIADIDHKKLDVLKEKLKKPEDG